MINDFHTLGEVIERNAVRYPQSPAVITERGAITYSDLRNKVNELARGLLAFGIKRGQRVALLMDNRIEWLIVAFSLGKIGAVLVPINIRYRRYDLDYVLTHSKPSILISIDHFQQTNFIDILLEVCPELLKLENGAELALDKFPLLKYIFCLSDQDYPGMHKYDQILRAGETFPVCDLSCAQHQVTPNDLVYIIYTSGTTSQPKGVMLTHSNICMNGQHIAKRIHINHLDKIWVPIPLFFSFGCITAAMSAAAAGASLVLQRHFDPREALQLIEKEKCTIMFATPNIYLRMMDDPLFEKSAIGSLRSGSIMGSPDQIRRVVEEMGVALISNTGYGMTETSALASLTDSNEPLNVRINTAGLPFPGVSIVIKDPETGDLMPNGRQGQICVKGYNVMLGYYDDREKTSEAFDAQGFLKTGDIGLINSEGYLEFKGRFKDMFKSGGINVSASEVEHFLQTHPEIEEAYVFGVPDEIKGEVGFACIRLSRGSKCGETDILAYCRANIATFKIPKYIRFQSSFPLTGSGKVQKFKLQEKAIEEVGL